MDRNKDAIDVEFETVGSTPSNQGVSVSAIENRGSGKANARESDQLAVFGNASQTGRSKPMSLPMFSAVASICAVVAFYLAGGHVLFKGSRAAVEPLTQAVILAPSDTAFSFDAINSEVIERGQSKIISLQATVTNDGAVAARIPPIMVSVGDDPATRRQFRIKRGETLGPGERLVFTNTVRTGDVPAGSLTLTFLD